jgi:hypothetical protein
LGPVLVDFSFQHRSSRNRFLSSSTGTVLSRVKRLGEASRSSRSRFATRRGRELSTRRTERSVRGARWPCRGLSLCDPAPLPAFDVVTVTPFEPTAIAQDNASSRSYSDLNGISSVSDVSLGIVQLKTVKGTSAGRVRNHRDGEFMLACRLRQLSKPTPLHLTRKI